MNGAMCKYVGVLALTYLLWLPVVTHASPRLQLGIVEGFYNTSTQTIVKDSDTLTVVALAKVPPQGNSPFGFDELYYLSIAIIPSIQPEIPQDLGSFDITTLDGIPTQRSFDVTDDLEYGTPPLDVVLTSKDLPSHSVFETYYAEIAFKFIAGDTVTNINTQDSPSTPLNESGSDLYFVKFDVDKSALDAEFELHFDLYDTTVKNGTYKVDGFAPFSHDAETASGAVPEPTTVLVWSLLIGMGLVYRATDRL